MGLQDRNMLVHESSVDGDGLPANTSNRKLFCLLMHETCRSNHDLFSDLPVNRLTDGELAVSDVSGGCQSGPGG